MAQRREARDALDDFPTPRWATRALMEHVPAIEAFEHASGWEPTCGRGFMAATLAEYFPTVEASDVHPYGYGRVLDFLSPTSATRRVDWIVTNPPFRLAEEFVRVALGRASTGVAMLVRTGFVEGAGRYARLFGPHPPSCVAQFVERVPILRGRVDPSASTATSYSWLVWRREAPPGTTMVWIPPCRRVLERSGDYDLPSPPSDARAAL